MRAKTQKTKELQGTLIPSRIKTYTGSAVGKSLLQLNDNEIKIYEKLKEHLQTHNASKAVDDIFLSIAARAIGHLLYNAEVLAVSGAVMVHPNGARQVSAGSKQIGHDFDTIVYIQGIRQKQFVVIGDRGTNKQGKVIPYEDNFWKKFNEVSLS